MVYANWADEHPTSDFSVAVMRYSLTEDRFNNHIKTLTSRLDADNLLWTEEEYNRNDAYAGYVCRLNSAYTEV